jgi:[ribosomal protein S5]-alanine N-acetyltransferase
MKIFAETERLLLREIQLTDVAGFFELDSDPEVHRYLGSAPVQNNKQIVEAIQFIRQQYINNGIGRWAVIHKKTNAFIGWAGLKLITEPINNHVNFYDLGYRFIRSYWGQGIATEAANASLAYAFDTLRTNEVYAHAVCENAGSNKVLSKVGLALIETFVHGEIKCNWYKIDRSEFERKRQGR